jgi:hypothetical protein
MQVLAFSIEDALRRARPIALVTTTILGIVIPASCASARPEGDPSTSERLTRSQVPDLATAARLFVAALAQRDTVLARFHTMSSQPIEFLLAEESAHPGLLDGLRARMDTVESYADTGAARIVRVFETPLRRYPSHCYPAGVGDRLTLVFLRRERWAISEVSLPPC